MFVLKIIFKENLERSNNCEKQVIKALMWIVYAHHSQSRHDLLNLVISNTQSKYDLHIWVISKKKIHSCKLKKKNYIQLELINQWHN